MLHLGAPKSGTTYLQSVIWNSRQRLYDAGVLVPGTRRFDHTRAASAVCSPRPEHVRPRSRYAVWDRFVRSAAEWPGTVLVSDEWFVAATAEQAARALDDLAGAEVHLVVTARDFVRQVPAAWQEELKLGNASSMTQFVVGLDDSARKWSWATLDAAEVLTRWAGSLPADRVHVVVVPPAGAPRDLLWHRFATACRIDPALGSADVVQANESLGVEAARLLQELGPSLRDAVEADHAHWAGQYRWLRRYLGHDLLVPLGGDKIGLDRETIDLVRHRTRASTKAISAAGWDVVGDLDELAQATFSESLRHPDSVTAEEMLEVAEELIPKLLGRVRTQTLRAEALQAALADAQRPAPRLAAVHRVLRRLRRVLPRNG